MRRAPVLLPVAALLVALAAISPSPAAAQSAPVLRLPFAAGTTWKVLQGYNGGTHVPGAERYALDIVRDGDGPTAGSDVLAPAGGALWFMNAPGSGNGCLSIKIDGGNGLIVQLCHIIARPFRTDERIQAGQIVGTIGPGGTVGNNGTAHVHISMHRSPDYGQTRIPMPFALPDGLPLEGQSLVPDGSYNQFGCPSSACRSAWKSTNGAATPSVPTAPVGPGTLPAPNPAVPAQPLPVPLPAAALAVPSAATVALRTGVIARVAGAGDCVNVREGPGMNARKLTCLTDGTSVTIAGGPIDADGFTWWQLEGRGWAVGAYLTGVTAPTPTLRTGAGAIVDAGANDCLNMRAAPSTAANVLTCIPSGARMTITDGPREADGYTWWQLDGKGWGVAEYLRPRDDTSATETTGG